LKLTVVRRLPPDYIGFSAALRQGWAFGTLIYAGLLDDGGETSCLGLDVLMELVARRCEWFVAGGDELFTHFRLG